MKNTWADKFTKKAKLEGYRARSAFKLIEINKKYKIINKGDIVLDIGAAPGSWLQVASEAVGPKGRVLGIDLQPIGMFAKNVETVVGDITKQESIDIVISKLNKINVVLCDIAPSTTGVEDADQYASLLLSETSFEVAKKVLKKGGKFICKIFQSREADEFIKEARKHFETCRVVKPLASRKHSKEVYFLGIRYAPTK